jgi:hypothetical protein
MSGFESRGSSAQKRQSRKGLPFFVRTLLILKNHRSKPLPSCRFGQARPHARPRLFQPPGEGLSEG